MAGVEVREKIWRVQMHPQKTPLGPDVDFRALAEQYEVSGGDIKNAVLKAAQMAAAEDGEDRAKVIMQRHLVAGMERVMDSKKVMAQSLFGEPENPAALLPAWQQALTRTNERFQTLEEDVVLCRRDLETVGGDMSLCRREIEIVSDDVARWRANLETLSGDVSLCRQELAGLALQVEETEQARSGELTALREELAALRAELQDAARAQSQDWEDRLRRLTLIPMPRWATLGLTLLALLASGSLGWAGAALNWLR
jgi:hypothetical protein